MPTFNEIIVTKKTNIAWDGGKATENLISNDGDLVFDFDWRRPIGVPASGSLA